MSQCAHEGRIRVSANSVVTPRQKMIWFHFQRAISDGDTAPLFSLSTYGGGTFDLAQQRGKVAVLLFLCVA
jgi:hypothetical protein